MQTASERFDESALRAEWRDAGIDVSRWDLDPARAEAHRLANLVERLRSLDTSILSGQLDSRLPEEFPSTIGDNL